MANPASIAVTSLAANDITTRPAGAAIDTDGDVPVLAIGKGDLILEVSNTDDAVLTVTVKAGDSAVAFRSGLGDLSTTVPITTGVKLIGPLESARFMRSDDTILVNFDAATGSPAATVRAYRMA